MPDGSWVLEELGFGTMDQAHMCTHTTVPNQEGHKVGCRTWDEEKDRVEMYLWEEEHTSRSRMKEGRSRREWVELGLAKTSDESSQNYSCSVTTSRLGCVKRLLPMILKMLIPVEEEAASMIVVTFPSGTNLAPEQNLGIQSSHCIHHTRTGIGTGHRLMMPEMKCTIRGRSAAQAQAQATRHCSY